MRSTCAASSACTRRCASLNRATACLAAGDQRCLAVSARSYLDQHNGGGVETTGAIEWVHAMLLQSRDGVLRLFPHLPETTRAARFVRLRTYVPHAPLGCSLQDWRTESRRYLYAQGRCVSGDCELQRGSCGVAGAGAERSRAALHHGGTHA